jgi:hypothetical protein
MIRPVAMTRSARLCEEYGESITPLNPLLP